MPSDHPSSGHTIPQVEVEVVLKMTVPPSPPSPAPSPLVEQPQQLPQQLPQQQKQFLTVPGATGDPQLDESLRPRSSSAPTIKLIDAGARIAAGAAKAVAIAGSSGRGRRQQNVNFNDNGVTHGNGPTPPTGQRQFKFRASCECVTDDPDDLTVSPANARRRKSAFRRYSLAEHREHIEHHFCRINVLLVTMQLGLGGSMTALGLFLHRLSPSMTLRECTFWAALPLLAAGLLGLYFCSADRRLQTASLATRLARTVCGSLSFFSSIACFVASVLSGYHGSFISAHNERCPGSVQTDGSAFPVTAGVDPSSFHNCCSLQRRNGSQAPPDPSDLPLHGDNDTACVCWTSGQPAYVYRSLSCLYVYSALKDYLILQCALMAVACGVCAWFLVVLWQSRLRHRRRGLVTVQHRSAANSNSVGKGHRCPMAATSASPSS